MIDGVSKAQLSQYMEQCYGSMEFHCRFLFPERFNIPFSWMHKKVFEALEDDRIQKLVIAANRGFGKTSCLQLGFASKRILFGDSKFIFPISCTNTQAEMHSENLKNELVGNSMINAIFGPQKSSNWSKEMWTTRGGIRVIPRGAGQQIRGMLHGNERPDLLMCDDLEDAESVRSEEQRKKMKDWFFADVLNAVQRAHSKWRGIVVGTVLHEDSLLSNLLEDPNWHAIRLELFDDNDRSNWPEFMDDSAIRLLIEGFRKSNQLDTLYREYRNLPISTESAKFRKEYFKYYEEGDIRRSREVESVVLCDPAKTLNPDSAETAIVGVGVNPMKRSIYFRDCVADKLLPDQIYERAFNMGTALGAQVLGYEVTSLNEFISYPLKNAMLAKKLNFELVELHARGKKEERIAALVPFYRQGQVYHNKSCCSGLEAQLLSYPRSKRFDIMDAFAYIVPMLDVGGRFFYAADEPNQGEEEELRRMEAEDEMDDYEEEEVYEELEKYSERPLDGWRRC